jgi:photosystem II stability/assembly factor-like uncharacterized protein
MKFITFLLAALFVLSSDLSSAQINGSFESSIITANTLVASSFINDNEGWMADDKALLWHTSNAGQTWSSVLTDKYFLKLQFLDPINGYGITADALYKTTESGNTWSALSLPGNIGTALYFLDKQYRLCQRARSNLQNH